MRFRLRSVLSLLFVLALSLPAFAQAPSVVQLTTPFTGGSPSPALVPVVVVIPITATAAVNTQAVLTIPTPPGGLSNYVCSLAYEIGNDSTGGVVTNAVTTSTNFNGFALKTSVITTAGADTGLVPIISLTPGGGCVKSTIPGTSTTFTSSAGLTHAAFTWYATYYQAP